MGTWLVEMLESSRKSDHCDAYDDDDDNGNDDDDDDGNDDHGIRDIVGKLNRVYDSKMMTLMMTMQGESRGGGKAKEAETEEGEEGVRPNPRIDSGSRF